MKLFKYVGLQSNSDNKINMITNGYFRFSPLESFNDTFEGLWANNYQYIPRIRYRHAVEKLKKINSQSYITWNMIQTLEGDNTLGEFSPRHFPGMYSDISNEDMNYYKGIYKHDLAEVINEQTKKIGVLSLTGFKNSQLMWSHYANCENGICIEFNSNHSYFLGRVSKVRYTNRRVSISEMTKEWQMYTDFKCTDDVNAWIKKNLRQKSNAWKYEKEYRLFKDIANFEKFKMDDFLYEKIPFDAWNAIYYGSELDKVIEEKFQEILFNNVSTKSIKKYKVIKNDKRYKYDIFEL